VCSCHPRTRRVGIASRGRRLTTLLGLRLVARISLSLAREMRVTYVWMAVYLVGPGSWHAIILRRLGSRETKTKSVSRQPGSCESRGVLEERKNTCACVRSWQPNMCCVWPGSAGPVIQTNRHCTTVAWLSRACIPYASQAVPRNEPAWQIIYLCCVHT
jgi:hypothetical protein